MRHKTGWWSLFSKLVGSEVGGSWHNPTTVLHKNTNTKHSKCVAGIFCTTLCVQGEQVVGWAATTIILRPISPRPQDLQVP